MLSHNTRDIVFLSPVRIVYVIFSKDLGIFQYCIWHVYSRAGWYNSFVSILKYLLDLIAMFLKQSTCVTGISMQDILYASPTLMSSWVAILVGLSNRGWLQLPRAMIDRLFNTCLSTHTQPPYTRAVLSKLPCVFCDRRATKFIYKMI